MPTAYAIGKFWKQLSNDQQLCNATLSAARPACRRACLLVKLRGSRESKIRPPLRCLTMYELYLLVSSLHGVSTLDKRHREYVTFKLTIPNRCSCLKP